MFNTTSSTTSSADPLTDAQREQLRAAARLHKPLRRCATVARWSGVTMVSFGALTVLMTLPMMDVLGAGLGAGLTALGLIELKHGPRIAGAQPDAARALGANQLILLALLFAYCVLQMVTSHGVDTRTLLVSPEFAAQMDAMGDTQFGGLNEQLSQWATTAFYGFYIAMMVGAVVFQGSLAKYYFGVRKAVIVYLDESETWARAAVADVDP